MSCWICKEISFKTTLIAEGTQKKDVIRKIQSKFKMTEILRHGRIFLITIDKEAEEMSTMNGKTSKFQTEVEGLG